MQKSKRITIGEHEYNIGRFTARTGSWILMQILTRMMPMGMDAQVSGDLSASRPLMSEGEFRNIQDHCLDVCDILIPEAGVHMPVFIKESGIFSPKAEHLEYDISAVMQLTIEALTFNLTPFFTGGGLQSLMASLPQASAQ